MGISDPPPTLTDTEIEIVTRFSIGQMESEISTAIGVPAARLDELLVSLYEKLDVSTRHQAVAEAFKQSLVTKQRVDAVRRSRFRQVASR